jgi:hypothetical protein
VTGLALGLLEMGNSGKVSNIQQSTDNTHITESGRSVVYPKLWFGEMVAPYKSEHQQIPKVNIELPEQNQQPPTHQPFEACNDLTFLLTLVPYPVKE